MSKVEDVIAQNQRMSGYENTRERLAEKPLESRGDYVAEMVILAGSDLISFGLDRDYNAGVEAALREAAEDLDD